VPAAAPLESVGLDGALVEGEELEGAAEEASPSRRFNDSSATLYLLLQSVCAVANALKSLMKFATAVRCSPWSCCAAGSLVNSASDCRAAASAWCAASWFELLCCGPAVADCCAVDVCCAALDGAGGAAVDAPALCAKAAGARPSATMKPAVRMGLIECID
jgi:hypothetical protein